jgi:hypothetical protein
MFRRMPRLIRLFLAIAPVLALLWGADYALSSGRTIGWERNSVRNSAKRWAAKPDAKVAIFGSSTSKDWLPAAWLGRGLGLPKSAILDAHINGCHQGCTWAEVRQMKAAGRRFDKVFIGTNLFQLCEFTHTKRVLQQQTMLPLGDIPRIYSHYLSAERPLLYWGRFLGVATSGAYGDAAAVRKRIERLGYGKEDPRKRATRRHNAWRWARKKRIKRTKPPLSCAYSDADIGLKASFTEGLLDDLSSISDEVYFILLPDRTRSLSDREYEIRWTKHLALHEALVQGRPQVQLIDLVTGGVRDPKKFRDGFHLNAKGMHAQRALFSKRMKALKQWRGR